jgi:hypothetical protein
MMTYRSIPAVVIVLLSCTTGMPAQNNPAPVKGMASTVGLYVYPRNNQTGVQQLTDEGQCYSSAKTQTGFDPNGSSPAATTSTPSQPKQGDHTVGKDAARGAAISGAAGGDPAMGARRGAMIGEAKKKREEKQEAAQETKTTDAAKSQQQQSMDGFKRSMSACLDARGYSVK